jgi:anti-sigma factor RsiW
VKRHDAVLLLAATGIDFPLTAADRARLNEHLAICAPCARAAAGMRADARELTTLPSLVLPAHQAAVVLESVRQPRAIGHPVRLAVIAALLGLLLLGSLVAGAHLVEERENRLSLLDATPVPTVPAASPAATEAPTTPDPSEPPFAVQDLEQRGFLSGLVVKDGGLVAVGRAGDDPPASQVWTSRDGRGWSQAPHQPAFDRGVMVDVVASSSTTW